MKPNRVIKRVRDLQEGDVTSSGWTVVVRPVRGLKTPSGKHEIVIRRGDYTRRVIWGSSTTIGIVTN